MRRFGSTIRKLIIVRNRSFGLLWTGQLLSSGGGWLLEVAVPVYVFQLTGSARDTGLTVVVEIAPFLVVGPLAGVFADRWSRRAIMICADLLRVGLVSLLLLADSASLFWLILLAVCAESCCTAFFTPAYQATVPALVGHGRDLEAANGWSAAARGAVQLSCAPLGGLLYGLAGFRLPVAVDAATYLASALLVSAIRVPARPADFRAAATDPGLASSRVSPQGFRALIEDMRVGVRALRDDRVLTVLLTASALFLLGNGGCTALLVPYVVGGLGVHAASLGELFSALGVGFLLSSYVGRRACASPNLRRTVVALLACVLLSFAGLFNLHAFVLAVFFMGLMGLTAGAFLMLEQTILQRRAPDQVLGRVSAVYSTVVMAATLAGALLASLVSGWVGRQPALNLAIALIACSALVASGLPAQLARPHECR